MHLTVPQLADLLHVTPRAIRKAIAAGRYATARLEDGGRGGSKGARWLVAAHDPEIPADARKRLGLITGARSAQEAEKMGIAPERLDTRTAARLRVLKRAAEIPPGIPVGEWYAALARDEAISVPTIYRWIAERKRGKIVSDRAPLGVALDAASGPLAVAVRSRSFAPQALEHGFSLLVRNPGLDVKRAYLEMAAEAEIQGWDYGSLATFYRKWTEIPDAVKTLASGGTRALESLVKPAIRRDLSAYKVYELLVGDQHHFDHTVLDDAGDPIRPMLFVWGDIRSRYLSGVWPVMGDYDKYSVGFALREACRWGIPDRLYTDWGKPERSDYVAHLRRQLSGYALFDSSPGETIGHTKAKPRNAQAKPIESWFRWAFEEPLKRRNLPGYSRQDKRDERTNEHLQRALREQIKGRKLLRAPDFFDIVATVVDEWNAHLLVEDQTRPEETFLTGIAQRSLVRLDDRTLDFLFLPAAIRQVRNSTVEMTLPGFGKCRWYAPELSGLTRRGRKARVEVRFDPYDDSVVHCLDLESHALLCTAERWGKIDPHDVSAMGDKIRRQNELLRHWRDIARQLARPEARLHRLTPYTGAAAAVTELDRQKKHLVVDDRALNDKIIHLARDLGLDLDQANTL